VAWPPQSFGAAIIINADATATTIVAIVLVTVQSRLDEPIRDSAMTSATLVVYVPQSGAHDRQVAPRPYGPRDQRRADGTRMRRVHDQEVSPRKRRIERVVVVRVQRFTQGRRV
jgi:hypothetical protein